MTAAEVFTEITKTSKWYGGYCSRQSATMIKKRLRDETMSIKAQKRLFAHFGYTAKETIWEQIKK